MTAESGPSFISYVTEAERSKEKEQKLADAMNKMYERPEKELENKLLPGEIAIGHAKKVIRYNVHDDPSRGISGTLVCTNFRLIFITAEKATYDLIELQNRLVSDHDILLNNIESIFIEYPNKRKRLVPSSKVKDGIYRLELHCKDFRVAAFNFKLTVSGEEKGVIKSILHHAYPPTVSLLFAFDYDHGRDVEKACKIPLYRTQADWENELRRCGVSKKLWRVAVMNKKLATLPTMGAYFVVPSSFRDNDLLQAADQFTGNRLPHWCWSDSNGCSLVRSSTLRPETEQQYVEDNFHEAIQNADVNKRPIKVIDVSEYCPSCFQLQQSFNKLKTICMPATESDFWETDSRWNTLLHSTKWLQYIGATLKTAKTAAEWMREKKHNIVIKEPNGVDLSSVVTSLIQLILDPTCRTLAGFQALIQREWVVAGHPFLDRLGHLLQPTKQGKKVPSVLTTGDNNTSVQSAPVFLLFLDCVYQMMVQYPARFEPSVTFLTVLYDATRTTAFDTFMFNNERQRHKCLAAGEHPVFEMQEVNEASSWKFLPTWSWDSQFNKTDMKLFNNPLYKMRTMDSYRKYVEASVKIRKTRLLSNEVFISHDNQNLNGDVPDCGPVFAKPQKDEDCSNGEGKNSKSPVRGGKHKTSEKEKRTEEHRRKMEKDSPFPLNKTRQKTGSLEESTKRTIGERSESIEESKKRTSGERSGSVEESKNNIAIKKEPYGGTVSGHFPKVALMPKHRHSTVARISVEIEPERRYSRSKSENDFDEDINNIDELPDDVTISKPTEQSSPKLKSKFSFRRQKKIKENFTETELSFEDVPTYDISIKDVLTQTCSTEETGSLHALYPCTATSKLLFWKQLYFRWIPWSQIFGGGPAAITQQESILYDEIHILHNKLQTLKRQLSKSDGTTIHGSSGEDDSFNTSGMYFNNHSLDNVSIFETNSLKSSSSNSLEFLPSYFPYSPVKDLRRRSVIGTPISNFLQGGSIFNFGRFRVGKHARSPSNISITHSTSQSIEDLSSATATDGSMSPSMSKSVEDLTSDLGSAPPSRGIGDTRCRTQSDIPGRIRLKHLDANTTKPRVVNLPSPTIEKITYITSL